MAIFFFSTSCVGDRHDTVTVGINTVRDTVLWRGVCGDRRIVGLSASVLGDCEGVFLGSSRCKHGDLFSES